MAYNMLRGTRRSPGLAMLLVGILTRYPNTWARFKTTFAAYRDAVAAVGSTTAPAAEPTALS